MASTACCYTTIPYGFQGAHTPFLSLAWHWQISNNVTNEVRGGWQGSDPLFGSTAASVPFYIQVPLINNPEGGFQLQGRDTTIANVQDNAVWTRGSHSIRFGGQFQGFYATTFGPGAFGQPYLPTYALGGGTTPAFTTGNTGSFNTAAGCIAATGVNCAEQYPGRYGQQFVGTARRLDWHGQPDLHCREQDGNPATRGATTFDRLSKLLSLRFRFVARDSTADTQFWIAL